MAKKKHSIVDSFVFRQAKEAVDNLSADNSNPQEKSNIISGLDHNHINTDKGSDIYQVESRDVSDPEHKKLSLKDHQSITSHKKLKSITKVSPRISLSQKQSQVFLWLKERGEVGVFNKPEIQHSLQMPYITVRKAIQKLEVLEIVQLNYDNCQKIYDYKLNLKKEIKLSKRISIRSGSYPYNNSDTSPSLISSSSSKIKKPTTEIIENIFISDPELGYWQELNLKPQQIKKWMNEIQINLEDVIDSLKHCRFDLIDNGLLESKPVRDPLSWVYKRLKQYGFYHAPKGYVSFEDKAIQRAKDRLKKKKERAKELAAIREAELEAERRVEFEKMMADPESDIYKKCFKKLNKIEKRLKGKGLVASMRNAFDNIVDEGEVEPS